MYIVYMHISDYFGVNQEHIKIVYNINYVYSNNGTHVE